MFYSRGAARVIAKKLDEKILFSNDLIDVEFSTVGLLKSITNKVSKRRRIVNNDMKFYETSRSGAYIFRPESPAKSTFAATSVVYFNGPICSTLIYASENIFATYVFIITLQGNL